MSLPFTKRFLSHLVLLFLVPASLVAQSSSEHYLFPEFGKAMVQYKMGEPQATELNYNTITEEMVYVQSGQYYALDQINTIDTVFIGTSRFVPFKECFLEIRWAGRIPYFVKNKNKLIQTGKSTGYGTSQTHAVDALNGIISSGKVYDLQISGDFELVPDHAIYLYHNNSFVHAEKTKELERIFPEKKNLIKLIIRENKLKLSNTQDFSKLLILLQNSD